MKIAIIDDEKPAADRLQDLLLEIDPSIKVLARLTSVEDSVKWLSINKPDLLFLDIQLSDGQSFSIFDSLQIDTPVIFTTAYDEYAIKAFKLNSIDYLLKPVNKNELSESITKFNKLSSPLSFNFSELLKNFSSPPNNYKQRFLIQFCQKMKLIEVSSVAFIYAMGKNVFLHTFNGNTYPIDYTLDNLTDQLDPALFFRINRKIIINLKAIKAMIPYSRSRIKLTLEPLPPKDVDPLVSVDRTPLFKEWLNK
jgi:two-component system, LytTR family, response regulator LytT